MSNVPMAMTSGWTTGWYRGVIFLERDGVLIWFHEEDQHAKSPISGLYARNGLWVRSTRMLPLTAYRKVVNPRIVHKAPAGEHRQIVTLSAWTPPLTTTRVVHSVAPTSGQH
jgi:hypothetical protein